MKSYSDLITIFRRFVNEVINGGDDHGYLEGTLGIINSKVYLAGIYDEINLVNKYFKKGGNILDFGTGAGLHSWLLAFKKFQIDGIDINNFGDFDGNTRATLNMSRDQKLLWNKMTSDNLNLNFKHYFGRIPFNNNYFDGIVASAVIEHIPDNKIDFLISEIFRVLKPGGYLLVSRLPRKYSYTEAICRFLRLGHHKKLYSKIEVENLLKNNNFVIKKYWLTDLFPSYPISITNRTFNLFKIFERFFLKTPLKYLSHDFRFLAKKL